MIENCKQRPNKKEVEALTLFYNRFYFLYDEISNENFKTQEPYTLDFIDSEKHFRYLKRFLTMNQLQNI